MATYQSDYQVKYEDEFQVRWSREIREGANVLTKRPARAVSGVIGASYGGTIPEDDRRQDRG